MLYLACMWTVIVITLPSLHSLRRRVLLRNEPFQRNETSRWDLTEIRAFMCLLCLEGTMVGLSHTESLSATGGIKQDPNTDTECGQRLG